MPRSDALACAGRGASVSMPAATLGKDLPSMRRLPLFERQGRQVQPTPQARRLLRSLQQAVRADRHGVR